MVAERAVAAFRRDYRQVDTLRISPANARGHEVVLSALGGAVCLSGRLPRVRNAAIAAP